MGKKGKKEDIRKDTFFCLFVSAGQSSDMILFFRT